MLAVAALAVAGLGRPAAAGAGDPHKQVQIRGLSGQAFLAGEGLDVSGGSAVIVHPDSGASFVSQCRPSWHPEDITQFKLIGKTMSFTVDLSRVGCACNLAVYLISAPAYDKRGKPVPGDNELAPGNFYCDANKVGGQWCPEVDLMEANKRAFQSTPHKCDPPEHRHYSSCDRSGCGQNTKDMGGAYGPGANYSIDTTKPFKVITSFGEQGGKLSSMVTRLQQGNNQVTLDHGNCQAEYYAALSPAMEHGMSLRITYWGKEAETMAWLDSPPCGSQTCTGSNSGDARITDVQVVQDVRPTPQPTPQPALQPSPQPAIQVPVQPVLDCSEGIATWESGWDQRKKDFCCKTEGNGCGDYDCFEHLSEWGSAWSPEKQAYCCRHKAQGCPESPGAPGAGLRQQVGPIRWSNHRRKCLSDLGGSNSNLVISDCVGQHGNEAQIWRSISDGRIRLNSNPRRCVDVVGKSQNGARVVVTECRPDRLSQEFSINTAIMKVQWKAHPEMCLDVTNHKTDNGTPLQLWECLRTDTDQVFAWPIVEAPLLPVPTPGSSTSKAFVWEPARTQAPATTPAPKSTTAFVWEPPTQAPPLGAMAGAATTTQARDLVPTTPTTYAWKPSTQAPQTTQADLFDCYVPDLKHAPYKKRVWCCRYKHKGCPVMIPQMWRYEPPVPYAIHTRVNAEIDGPRTTHLLHPGDVFRIVRGREGVDGVLYLELADGKGWAFESKPGIGTMCVENTHFDKPYDCVKDFHKWEQAWSPRKKAWCCHNSGRGCLPGRSPTNGLTSSAPYNCAVGFEHWKSTWTPSKASWCCDHEERGCMETAPARFDCTIWFPGYDRTWPQNQRSWCCAHKAKGCLTEHDCHAGLPVEWSHRKRLWCCTNRDVGCAGNTAHFSRQFSMLDEHGQQMLGQIAGLGNAKQQARHVQMLAAGIAGLASLLGVGFLAMRYVRQGRRVGDIQIQQTVVAGSTERLALLRTRERAALTE